MQFRAIRADCVAGHFTPETRDGLRKDREGAACHRRASKDRNRTTHDANPTHEPAGAPLSLDRSPRREGSWSRLSRDIG
jgi:hypothetical protein